MPVQILLLLMSTSFRPTRLAFRMRVSMSAMGSWLFIVSEPVVRFPFQSSSLSELPAGLFQARDFAGERELAEHDAGDLELPQRALAPARELAAVVRPRRAAVARQVRQRGVVLFLLELTAHVRKLLHQRRSPLLLCYPGFRCHICVRCPLSVVSCFRSRADPSLTSPASPFPGRENRTA